MQLCTAGASNCSFETETLLNQLHRKAIWMEALGSVVHAIWLKLLELERTEVPGLLFISDE